MNRVARSIVISVAVAAGASLGLGGTAWAAAATSTTVQGTAPTATLSGIQTKAAAAIQRRIGTLNDAVAKVSGSRWLSSTDRATLLSLLHNDISGLTALGNKIQGDTSVAQATADYKSVFLGYRVYDVVVPEARMAAAADKITGAALPRLNDANARLTALLQGKDASKDTPTVKSEMAQLATEIQTVTSNTSGLSSQILSFTPADYNANHAVLSGARQTLMTARSDVLSARADALQVLASLR